jgi:hypothetical protein
MKSTTSSFSVRIVSQRNYYLYTTALYRKMWTYQC